MRRSDPDVLIVGLGAAGATAAHVLTDCGARVVGIDAGDWAPSGDGWFERSRPTGRSQDGGLARPDRLGASMANAIGGSKHVSANQSYRLPPWTHRMLSSTIARHGEDVLAPDHTLADWPITAAELAPYHDLVERLQAVEPSPSAAWTDLMSAAAQRLGWTPFPAPVATAEPIGGTLLAPALDSGRLAVLTNTIALGLTVDRRGQVDGARVWHAGRERELFARRLILAAHTYENVRLLLLSRSVAHPQGLGNSHGQLGLHFATHSFVSVRGVFPQRDLARASGRLGHATAVADFDTDALDPVQHGFIGGSILQASMGTEPGPRQLARSGADPRAVGRVWAQPEQLTRVGHRLDLDPTHVDALDRPVLRITHGLAPDDRRRARYLQDRLERWLHEAGATELWREPITAQLVSSHAYGGTRMGADPRSSVVNGLGALHEDPGLIVLGASTFPSTGGRGPTQTIEALAWRCAETLAGEGFGRSTRGPSRA